MNKLLLPAGSLREKWLSGLGAESSTYVFASWLLPRALGFVALIAVLSFWTQYKGLIGTEGILPFSKDLEAVTAYCETNPESPQKYLLRPTVLWLWEDPDNSNLQTILVVTFVASLFAISGIAQAISLALIWLGYLSPICGRKAISQFSVGHITSRVTFSRNLCNDMDSQVTAEN